MFENDNDSVEARAAQIYCEWPCSNCQGIVDHMGVLATLAWGRCIECDMDNYYVLQMKEQME